jgi:GT2 family glycosyltransferase
MNGREKVYIILVNYNGWKDTIECLESVLRIDYPAYQVIVCDNGSADSSLEKIRAWADGRLTASVSQDAPLLRLVDPPLKKPLKYTSCTGEELRDEKLPGSNDAPLIIVDTKKNLGFAGGNNTGLRFAQLRNDYSHIWFLNNDTVIEPDTLSELVAKHERCLKQKIPAGIIGSKLLYYDRPDTIQAVGGIYYNMLAYSRHIGAGQPDDGRFDRENIRMDYVVGASMLVSRAFLDDVGPMNEDYFIYYEEADLIERGRKKGWETAYAWRSRVYHKEGASIGANKQKRTKSDFAVYYFFRNAMIFTRQYHPLCLITVIPRIAATIVFRLLKGDTSKVRTMLRAVKRQPYISTEQDR